MTLLQEYGPPAVVEGDPADLLRSFQQANERWSKQLGTDTIFRTEPTANGVRVSATGVIGQLTVHGHDFEIAPKYIPRSDLDEWRATVFDILQFSQAATFGFSGPTTGSLAGQSFVDMLARGFVDALEPELDRGAPTSYQRTQYQSETVEGKLLTDKLYPQALTDPTHVWVEASHLTSDTVLGRALRFAARRFAALTSLSALRGRLLDIDARLSDAAPTPPSLAALNGYFLPPQYRSFEQAFEIASWLIHEQGASLSGDTTSVEGILLKSHSIYQDFVHRCIQHVAQHRDWDVSAEPTITVATGPQHISAFPDHVITTANTQLVLDSKYKGSTELETTGRATLSAPAAADAYQVAMAGRVVDSQSVGLAYPADTPESAWTLQGNGCPERIHMLTIDPIAFHRDREQFFNTLAGDLDDLLQA